MLDPRRRNAKPPRELLASTGNFRSPTQRSGVNVRHTASVLPACARANEPSTFGASPIVCVLVGSRYLSRDSGEVEAEGAVARQGEKVQQDAAGAQAGEDEEEIG